MPEPAYVTELGRAFCGDALKLLDAVEDESVDLVITSPPFALQRQKKYGNTNGEEYENWLASFAEKVHLKLKDTGSFVLDLGGAYNKGVPSRSLYNYRILIRLCEDLGFHLAQEFFWHNPSKLPSPTEWTNKRKIRAKDSVNTVWWLSKTDWPKADISKVLVPYSARMRKLLENPDKYYTPKERPSEHEISRGFGKDNGGAIPSNLLEIPNSDSNSQYLRYCKELGIKGHPARFPYRLPEFFIKFLTEPGDLVLDIFGGSNTTGEAAEDHGRRWVAFEKSLEYLATSSLRFATNEEQAKSYHDRIKSGECVHIPGQGH